MKKKTQNNTKSQRSNNCDRLNSFTIIIINQTWELIKQNFREMFHRALGANYVNL